MKLYEIVFSGQLVPGAQPDLVKANMVKLFQADAQRIALLFSGRRLVLKNNLDEAAAEKYRSTLERAGAMAQVVPMAPVVQAPVVAAPGLVEVEEVELAPPPDEPSWTRKPSNLTAPRNDATPTRKASVKPRDVYMAAFVDVEAPDYTLSEPGQNVQDPKMPARAPQLDLSGLSLAPAGADLGQDKPVEHALVPDVSHIRLA
ncbi:hypothetical protein JN403_10760 [Pseudomonas sp. 15A4]|uniref:hypothetical protein n=1 Tax=Pseudomonas sp. 15A4 TaxID=2804761 RepID=UPI00196787E8|nr:hypothetical protein [Pseudomonas sp. 15A4]QSB21269.1 hypothetical protein JN403_10760 [Pseudomonas sp. 15A4]